MMKKLLFLIVIAFVLNLASVPSYAIDKIWTGQGVNVLWSTADNWDNSTLPDNGYSLFFDGDANVSQNDLLNNVNGITFNNGASAFTLLGNAITLSGNVLNNDADNQTIQFDMLMNATRTFSASSGNITTEGILSGAGGLTKTGANTLTLSGNNSYLGLTDIQEGTLTLGRNGGTIADTNSIQVSGGTLNVANSDTVDNITISSGTISGAGTLTANSYDLTNTGTISVNLAGGAGTTLTKTGAGTAILSGDNSYSGLTDVQEGTLSLQRVGGTIGNLAAVRVSGGTLDVAEDDWVGTVTLTNGAISGDSTLVTTGTFEVENGNISARLEGSDDDTALNKTTGGTVTLSGNNAYRGLTTVSAGELDLNTTGGTAIFGNLTITGGTAKLMQSNQINDAKNLVVSGGILNIQEFNEAVTNVQLTSGNINGSGGTLTSSNTFDVRSGTISAILGGNVGLNKTTAGTVTLSGANSYTGATTVSAGTLNLNESLTASALGFAGASTVTLASTKSISGAITTTLNNQGILNFAGTHTTGGTIGEAGTGLAEINILNGTLTLGHNIAATTVTVDSDAGAGTGTLTLSSDRTITGNLALANSGIINLGTNKLTLNGTGVFSQGAGQTVNLTIANTSTFGKVVASGNSGITGGTVNVSVGSEYIPQGAVFTIVDNGGGTTTSPVITSNNSRVTFLGSNSNGDLILTANRTSTGFSSLGTDSDSAAVGAVLDDITDPSSDMTTILNTLEGLSDGQTSAALDTMVPVVDAGVHNTTTASLNNFVSASLERAQDVMRLADKVNGFGETGVSSGDEASRLTGIWAKGYGSHLNQGTRKGVAGYKAWNLGTALGADHLFGDNLTLGASGGYAYGRVNSKVNNGRTAINSGQGTLYGEYQNEARTYFIDMAGSFAWNWYDGKRDVVVGTINRTAFAEYEGQQYDTYLGGGYNFDLGNNFTFTPLASLQWDHLHLNSYTETGAGSMNLSQKAQSFNLLQSGVGAKLSYDAKTKWALITPEIHGKWLYDFIGDNVAITSTFTGGGAAFDALGAKPARNSFNAGGKLSFGLDNNVSLVGTCDTEMKEEYFGIYGTVEVRYAF